MLPRYGPCEHRALPSTLRIALDREGREPRLSPEERAREKIDALLTAAGWIASIVEVLIRAYCGRYGTPILERQGELLLHARKPDVRDR
jgi:hypothetical protein